MERMVRLDSKTCSKLKKFKISNRESYDEIINRLIELKEACK